MKKIERRAFFEIPDLETREGEDGTGTVQGYAAVFYDGTEETEFEFFGIKERVMPGAFDRALEEKDDVRVLFNHDPDNLLGRTSAGTAKLEVFSRGLRYRSKLPDTQVAHDVREQIRVGNVTGSSFGFEITDQTWVREDEIDIREIRGVRLYDVGPVTFPAYSGTSAQARSTLWIEGFEPEPPTREELSTAADRDHRFRELSLDALREPW